MRDVHETRGHDALQEVGLLQAALDPDPGLKHKGPELPQAHIGEFLRVVRGGLGLDDLDLFSRFSAKRSIDRSIHVVIVSEKKKDARDTERAERLWNDADAGAMCAKDERGRGVLNPLQAG